ncbi:dynactin subunit 4 [Cercophora scortea]|uniref:Dynactin subunit 4 n=1 Tax=Cercophora scortea TaxID=314031 RepID=A0AAE0IUQ3_9PEZI|nr:dynactin subunit 4 [Cercophora scortea]
MAPPFTPYTFIQCPCSDSSTFNRRSPPSTPTTHHFHSDNDDNDDDDDEHPFDPRAPRSNYSLFPLEYLLYCEDCHQIRCPRCVAEEIVTYYCPSCLFEVPSSNLKSEGNRCTRSCFQCPVCIGPLSVTSLESHPDPNLIPAPDNTSAAPHGGPYILICSHCAWSSTEVGIQFDKPNSIHAQLAKLRNGGNPRMTAKERKERRKDLAQSLGSSYSAASGSGYPSHFADELDLDLDLETQFSNLKLFYQSQLANANPGGGASGGSASGSGGAFGDLGFTSPTSLSRILNIYTSTSSQDKKAKSRIGTMREALDRDEGLKIANLDESEAIAKLHAEDHAGTVSTSQLLNQTPQLHLGEPHLHGRSRFASELRPIPYLLRTKRSKRCPICRHIISKPEAKVLTTRFRIRLVAGSYIPSITIRPLSLPNASTPDPSALRPSKPAQFVLTFKNPIFEPVKITLATPALTPGRFPSKVTVLCPQFDIDANTDVWDEALKDGDKRRKKGESMDSATGGNNGGQHQHQPAAGKIWERGRNWVSIVVEVVPASLRKPMPVVLKEDEDLLEIPMFVRIEWETDAMGDEVGAVLGKDRDLPKLKRELAYWCVLGLGRVSDQ